MALHKDELRKIAEALKLTQNQVGIADFDGYSPDEMDEMIYNPFSQACPVQLNEVERSELRNIPLLNLTRQLLETTHSGKIKLTRSGHLPLKLVKEIYALGYYKDEEIENGDLHLSHPSDSYSILIAHVLLHIMKAIRDEKGNVVITKKGSQLMVNEKALLKEVILTYGQQINWSAFDQFGDNKIGMIGWAFSLALLHRYGTQPISPTEIAFKYFRAYPTFLGSNDIDNAYFCYVLRTIERFMHLLGLVRIEKLVQQEFPSIIEATPLLHKLISIRPPGHFQDTDLN